MNNASILTKTQTKTFTKRVAAATEYDYDKITVTVRYDDQCGNGHNTFSITGETTRRGREDMGGCIHEEIAKHFPQLVPFIKWHLTSSDGPVYYVENALYHASNADVNAARSCSIWPDATLEQLQDKTALLARLPALRTAFRTDVESLGFIY